MNLPVDPPPHLQLVSGSGRTFQVNDLLRNRLVALKWAGSRVQVQGLKGEWGHLSRLSTRFVPEPVELLIADANSAYMTSAWLPGIPFAQYLAETSPEDGATAVLDALAGLDHLHGAGLCHSDIRSRNLLVQGAPSEPHVYWLDLEHAVTRASLYAGSSSAAQMGPGGELDFHAVYTQHDIHTFLVLLAGVLRETKAHPLSHVLREFAERANNSFYLDEMPHARAAWTLLRDALQKAGFRAPAYASPLAHPRYIQNTRALTTWRKALREWQRASDRRVIRMFGPMHIGKRAFLSAVGADLSQDGLWVTSLLGVHRPEWSHVLARDPRRANGEQGWSGRVVWLEERDLDFARAQQLLDASGNVLLVLVSDAERAQAAPPWAPGTTVVDWPFEVLSTRDGYRWTQASA